MIISCTDFGLKRKDKFPNRVFCEKCDLRDQDRYVGESTSIASDIRYRCRQQYRLETGVDKKDITPHDLDKLIGYKAFVFGKVTQYYQMSTNSDEESSIIEDLKSHGDEDDVSAVPVRTAERKFRRDRGRMYLLFRSTK